MHATLLNNPAFIKYLDRYGEREIKWSTELPSLGQLIPIVIPVFDESPTFFERLCSQLGDNLSILWIMVFNCPEGAASEAINETGQCHDQLLTQSAIIKKSGHLTLGRLKSGDYLLAIDRFNTVLPKKQGVGLARKIGFDVACQMMRFNQLALNWIATTDADAILPFDYCTIFSNSSDVSNLADLCTSALIFPFKHVGAAPTDDSPTLRATLLYEQHLHHYVQGLREAGSPYAYHSLGSTLAIHPIFYTQVRGFPKRAAGEDFYLLNKLNKLAPVISLAQPTLLLRARHSQRAPFGTGPSVKRILEQPLGLEGIPSYHPDCFKWLAILLNLFQQVANAMPDTRMNTYHKRLEALGSSWSTLLEEIGLSEVLPSLLRQHKPQVRCLKVMHDWFDAFRTLKFIHKVRDRFHGEVLLTLPTSSAPTTGATTAPHDRTPTPSP